MIGAVPRLLFPSLQTKNANGVHGLVGVAAMIRSNTPRTEIGGKKGSDLEEDESTERASGGGEVVAESGDEAVAVAGVQLHGHCRRGERGGGGRHGCSPRVACGLGLELDCTRKVGKFGTRFIGDEESLCGPSNATREGSLSLTRNPWQALSK